MTKNSQKIVVFLRQKKMEKKKKYCIFVVLLSENPDHRSRLTYSNSVVLTPFPTTPTVKKRTKKMSEKNGRTVAETWSNFYVKTN